MSHPVRIPPLAAGVVAAALALGACASNGPVENRYASETDRLASDCQARGGILAPTGAQTGRPQTDNICKISGGASRLQPDRD